jgi:C4-type Zn-finger protein
MSKIVSEQNTKGKKKLTKRQERILQYKATHKLLCPQCEGTTTHKLLLKHIGIIPFLVKAEKPCETCGYDGMFVEVPLNE